MLAFLLPVLLVIGLTHAQASSAQDARAEARARMVAEIAAMARETGGETGRPKFSDAVMAAMGKVPRHRFVPFLQNAFAYDNRPPTTIARCPSATARRFPSPTSSRS